MTTKALRSTILLPVFLPAVFIILLLVIGTSSNPELAGKAFSIALTWITETFGWFYMLSVAIFLVFIVSVAASSWGNIKLGPDHSEPQYSFAEWFAMLFSAGYVLHCSTLVLLSLYCIMHLHLRVRQKQLTLLNKQCKLHFSIGDFIYGQYTEL